MSCGAALYFDEQTDAAVRGLWQIIEDAGLPSNMLQLNYPPHMSILLCDETDVEGCGGSCRTLSPVTHPCRSLLPRSGCFQAKAG